MKASWNWCVIGLCAAMLFACAGFGLAGEEPAAPPIRVACVGDSITRLSGYPDELARLLSADYELSRFRRGTYDVRNFGVNATTALARSEKPYARQPACQQAKDFQPDIVLIMLGTNDTRKANPNTYQHIGDFVPDYKALIGEFLALESKPKVWVCLPVPICREGRWGLNNENLTAGVIPGVKQAAAELGLPLIDMYAALSGHPEMFPDNVHPNREGARLIAGAAYRAITGLEPPASLLPPPATVPGENLLANPGAEDGPAGWTARGGELEFTTAPVRTGTRAVKLSGRTAAWHGPGQDVAAALNRRGPGDYFLQAWVRLASGPGKAQVTLMITDGKGTRYVSSPMIAVNNTGWTDCTTLASITWTDPLKSALLCIQASPNDTLYADDLALIRYTYPTPEP